MSATVIDFATRAVTARGVDMQRLEDRLVELVYHKLSQRLAGALPRLKCSFAMSCCLI